MTRAPLVCHRVGCPELGQPPTHPIFLPGSVSPKFCVVSHLEQGKDPWVPDRGDMSPATARETWRGPGSGESEPGPELTLGLGSYCTVHLPWSSSVCYWGQESHLFGHFTFSTFLLCPWALDEDDHTALIPTSPPFSCSPLFAGSSTFACGHCVRGWERILIQT